MKKPNEKLEAGRIRTGQYASVTGDLHGTFIVNGPTGTALLIMSSGTGPDAEGWEHVSVSTERRTPNWGEMSWVKNLFWEEDELVVQYHPVKSEYVNLHPHCLHLWRALDCVIPVPPSFMVGPK